MRLLVLIVLFLSANSQSFYKCEGDDGRLVFQDTPCSADDFKTQKNVQSPSFVDEQSHIDIEEVARINSEFRKARLNKVEHKVEGGGQSEKRAALIIDKIKGKGISAREPTNEKVGGIYWAGVIVIGVCFLSLMALIRKRKKSLGESNRTSNLSRTQSIESQPSNRVYKKTLKTRDIYNVPAKLPKEFVIIDFETTGLDASQDEIVQFGGLRVKGGVVTDEIEFLVNTFIPINPNAQAVHGITKDLLVKYGVSQKEAFKKINEFINDSQMMAYNAVFDAGFLDVGADRYGYFFRKRRMICLLRFSRKVWPDLRNHKLQTVVDNIGSGKLQKHTALSDCYMAYDVYCAGVEKANAIQASTYQ